jgi:hypothetical protein
LGDLKILGDCFIKYFSQNGENSPPKKKQLGGGGDNKKLISLVFLCQVFLALKKVAMVVVTNRTWILQCLNKTPQVLFRFRYCCCGCSMSWRE